MPGTVRLSAGFVGSERAPRVAAVSHRLPTSASRLALPLPPLHARYELAPSPCPGLVGTPPPHPLFLVKLRGAGRSPPPASPRGRSGQNSRTLPRLLAGPARTAPPHHLLRHLLRHRRFERCRGQASGCHGGSLPPALGWMRPRRAGAGGGPEPPARVTFSSLSARLRGCARLPVAETQGEFWEAQPPHLHPKPCSGVGHGRCSPFLWGSNPKIGVPLQHAGEGVPEHSPGRDLAGCLGQRSPPPNSCVCARVCARSRLARSSLHPGRG